MRLRVDGLNTVDDDGDGELAFLMVLALRLNAPGVNCEGVVAEAPMFCSR